MTNNLDNVVILTSGVAGSSVVTGLLERAGYWTGENTASKPDYDTKENLQFIQINEQLLRHSGFNDDYAMNFKQDYVDEVLSGDYSVYEQSMRCFLDQCDTHRPWILKDPRLMLTVGLWKHFLSSRDVKYILLDREPFQSWISTTLRRQIQPLSKSNTYLHNTQASFLKYLNATDSTYLSLRYEDLLLRPESEISRINQFLGTRLAVADLQAIYNGKLYVKPRTMKDAIMALLIYLKNYRQSV